MADFNIIISNFITPYGPGQPSLWNGSTWNGTYWADGQDSPMETQTTHPFIEDITLGLEVTTDFQILVTLLDELTLSSNVYSRIIADSSGWSYVFPDNTTETEDRSYATWVEAAQTAASYTSATAPSTIWS